MSSFKFVKDNDTKKINTETVALEDEDEFVISKKTFETNPETIPNEELGEEFLINEEDVEEEEDGYEDTEDVEEYEQNDPLNNQFMSNQEHTEKSYEQIQQEKSHYLYQLNRLQKRGFTSSRRYGMEHSLEDIRGEVFRMKKEIDMDNGIDYCRQGLMFCVSTVEMLNGQYNIGGKLNGWSQAVMGNIDSYDEVFEELYEKYYSTVKMAPEIKLMTMIAGSAFMFHLQKSLLNNETLAPRQREMTGPSIDTEDLLKQLNEEVDLDNMSNSSGQSSIKLVYEEETKNIPIKKRGRPAKQKK